MTLPKINLPLGDNIVSFSTRRGTDSPESPYAGFNACHYTGDTPEHIASCRTQLCHELHLHPDNLIIPKQTHSSTVRIIDRIPFPEDMLCGVDALVTKLPNVALCINTADCAPLLMYDESSGIIAAVHSGWRGTIAGIAVSALQVMVRLGAEPSRIRAAIGPMICSGCFEVGQDVADIFLSKFPHRNTVINGYDKPHIDLAEAIRISLAEAGVDPADISGPPACSRCGANGDFFSARRQGICSGRTLSVIMLR